MFKGLRLFKGLPLFRTLEYANIKKTYKDQNVTQAEKMASKFGHPVANFNGQILVNFKLETLKVKKQYCIDTACML